MSDTFVPDADAAEQAVAVDDEEPVEPRPTSRHDVPEADAWEQAIEVGVDDEHP